MAIVVRSSQAASTVLPSGFALEADLEQLLTEFPDLLRPDGTSAVAFVDRQVDLHEAGILDALFVNADGLPIAVEVKLARNGESRREVVAQAIDYLASLTQLTVDELDDRVGARLEAALRSFDEGGVNDNFERRWQAVGANLRAGLARLVVAIDEVPGDLERIFQFLARNSELDVQLVTIQRFTSPGTGEAIVPKFLLAAESPTGGRGSSGTRSPLAALMAVVDLYNLTAPPEFTAGGMASNYRMVGTLSRESGLRVHYEFIQARGMIGAELHIESDKAKPLADVLRGYAGRSVAGGRAQLAWDQKWSTGRGRLAAQFPAETDPAIVAEAMRDLIALTRSPVAEKIRELVGRPVGR